MAAVILKLYVTDHTPRSRRALQNVEELTGRNGYELEVIDILQHPDMAESAKVIATPMLMRVSPGPVLRIIGDLSDVADLHALLSGDLVEGAGS